MLRDEWLRQIETHVNDAGILLHGSRFFEFNEEKKFAEELRLKAEQLKRENADLNTHFTELSYSAEDAEAKATSLRSLAQLEAAFEETPDVSQRFYIMTETVEAAVVADQLQRAKTLAVSLLELAENHRKDWNYGNAIYEANLALAKVAKRENDIPLAGAHLIKASETPGSPQLDSFGPEFDLASELYLLGERDVVKSYLKNCSKFWELDGGHLKKWLSQIENGETPSFNKHEFDVKSIFNHALSFFGKALQLIYKQLSKRKSN